MNKKQLDCEKCVYKKLYEESINIIFNSKNTDLYLYIAFLLNLLVIDIYLIYRVFTLIF